MGLRATISTKKIGDINMLPLNTPFVAAAFGFGLLLAPWIVLADPVAGSPATAPTAVVTDPQVVASMKKGIEYLLKTKAGDHWDDPPGQLGANHTCGPTALALYALLTAGKCLDDDPISDRVAF